MLDKEKILDYFDKEISALNHIMYQGKRNVEIYDYSIELIKYIKKKLIDGEFDKD